MKKYIAIIIILISISSYGEQDKDFALPELGDRVSGAVSYNEEKIIGKEFLKQIYSQAPLINDPLIQEYTELLVYKLSEYSNVKDRKFTVLLIDDDSLNALPLLVGLLVSMGGLF